MLDNPQDMKMNNNLIRSSIVPFQPIDDNQKVYGIYEGKPTPQIYGSQ